MCVCVRTYVYAPMSMPVYVQHMCLHICVCWSSFPLPIKGIPMSLTQHPAQATTTSTGQLPFQKSKCNWPTCTYMCWHTLIPPFLTTVTYLTKLKFPVSHPTVQCPIVTPQAIITVNVFNHCPHTSLFDHCVTIRYPLQANFMLTENTRGDITHTYTHNKKLVSTCFY